MGNSFKKPGIAVIRLHGVIVAKQANTPGQSKVNFETARPLIDKAFKTKNLKAVLLSINSPGGSPVQVAQQNFITKILNHSQTPSLQCELISSYLRELAEEKKVPVYAFVEDAGRKFNRHVGFRYSSQKQNN